MAYGLECWNAGGYLIFSSRWMGFRLLEVVSDNTAASSSEDITVTGCDTNTKFGFIDYYGGDDVPPKVVPGAGKITVTNPNSATCYYKLVLYKDGSEDTV